MSEYKNFSSLPPETERQFVVYEKHSAEWSSKALIYGAVSALIFAAITIVIVFSFEPPESKMKGDDMGMLERKPAKEAVEQPAAAPAATEQTAGDSADEAAGGADEAADDSTGDDSTGDDSAEGDSADENPDSE